MCDIIRNAMGKYLKRLGIILLAAAFSLFLISGPVFAVPSDNDTNPTPDTSEEEQTEEEDQEQTTCYDEVGGIGWLVCPGTSFLANIIDGAYGILNELINVEPVSMEQDAPIHVVWEYLRNLANIAFIIVFIIIIYSQMTGVGISNYGIKRMLPRLIIAAILLNLSYIICAIAVDLSNIVGGGFRSIFDAIGENALANGSVSDAAASTSVAGIVATILGIGTAGTIGALAITGGFTGLIWLLIPIILSGALAIISALITMAARQALILLLVMISPLAFVAYLLPNTEKWFKKWTSLFISMLVFYPMFSILYGASNLAGLVMITSATNWLGVILGVAVMVLPLFMSIPLLRMSGTVLGRIDGMVHRAARPADARLRGISAENRRLAKARQLSSTSYRPSTRLAQYLNQRNVNRANDLADAQKTADDRANAKHRQSHYNSKGQLNRRGLRYYNNAQLRMNAGEVITKFNTDMDEGYDKNDTAHIRSRDAARVDAINAGYSKAIAQSAINASRQRVVNMENLKRRADTIQTGLQDADSELSRQVAKSFNYQHQDAATVANMTDAQREAYQNTTSRAMNAVLSDAIAAKRKADAESKSMYSELYNDMLAGPEISKNLEKSFQTKDYNSMTAAVEVMAKRGDYDAITNVLVKHSGDISNDIRVQKQLADTLITMKKDDALLWSWSKALMMRRGMNGAGKSIEAYVNLSDYIKGTPLAGDIDANAAAKVRIDTLIPNIGDPGIGKTQDRTFWKSIQDLRVQGLISDPHNLGLSMKQIRSTAASGTVDGETLATINSLLTGGLDKIQAGTANAQEIAFFNNNRDAIKDNVISYLKDMSAGQLVTSKSGTMKALDGFLQYVNPGDTVTTAEGSVVSREFYEIFEHQRTALNKQSATSQRATMNPEVRKMLGIDLD